MFFVYSVFPSGTVKLFFWTYPQVAMARLSSPVSVGWFVSLALFEEAFRWTSPVPVPDIDTGATTSTSSAPEVRPPFSFDRTYTATSDTCILEPPELPITAEVLPSES